MLPLLRPLTHSVRPILLSSTNKITTRAFNNITFSRMRVIPVPVRSDNYAYLLVDPSTNTAAAVDPYDVKKVVAAAEKEKVKLGEWLITTHHHADHSGGNEDFKKRFPGVKVVGGSEQCSGLTQKVKDGDSFTIGKDLDINCIATPCHTQDSIAFVVTDRSTGEKGVFTGDTLFIAGCGRFFEGTPAEMHRALNHALSSLPDSTVIYPGHEYTKSNVAFGASVEPENEKIAELKKFCEGEGVVTTGKFTIGDEKKHNVFMRLNEPAVVKYAGTEPGREVDTMEVLREKKNNFRG